MTDTHTHTQHTHNTHTHTHNTHTQTATQTSLSAHSPSHQTWTRWPSLLVMAFVQFYVCDGELSCQLYQRSGDMVSVCVCVGRVFRRRGGADRLPQPDHRRGALRDERDQRVPRHPLRDPRGADGRGRPGNPRGVGGEAGGVGERGKAAGGPAAQDADQLRPSR